jgi:hypothetical protein
LQWEQLGKSKDKVPMLTAAIAVTKAAMGHKIAGKSSTREMVQMVIKQPLAQAAVTN